MNEYTKDLFESSVAFPMFPTESTLLDLLSLYDSLVFVDRFVCDVTEELRYITHKLHTYTGLTELSPIKSVLHVSASQRIVPGTNFDRELCLSVTTCSSNHSTRRSGSRLLSNKFPGIVELKGPCNVVIGNIKHTGFNFLLLSPNESNDPKVEQEVRNAVGLVFPFWKDKPLERYRTAGAGVAEFHHQRTRMNRYVE